MNTTYFCESCDYRTDNKRNYSNHMTSNKHKKNAEGKQNAYSCECCNYNTIYKYHYTKHMSSTKHETMMNAKQKKLQPNQCALCLRQYSCKSALSKHKHKCKGGTANNKNNETSDDDADDISDSDVNNKTNANNDVIDVLLKKNDELLNFVVSQQTMFMSQQQQITTIVKTLATNGISNNTNNSHNNNLTNTNNSHNTTNNQTFNINYFLNEHCKNAVDIHDFIQNLDYSQESLKKNAHLTYPARITKQIREGLGNYNVEDRPIHCSDEKRKKIYIKHNGEWVTEYKFNDVVSKIGENNTGTFRQWAIENPNFRHLDTPEYEQYMKIYPGSIGPTSDEQEERYSKRIIGGIIDEILIDKEKYAT